MGHVKSLDIVQQEIGSNLTFDPDSITGSINNIKGTSDIKVDLVGSKGRGKLYFKGTKISPHEWDSSSFFLTVKDHDQILL